MICMLRFIATALLIVIIFISLRRTAESIFNLMKQFFNYREKLLADT